MFQKRYKIWIQLLRKADGKAYTVHRMVKADDMASLV